MIENLPAYIPLLFILTTFITVFLFYRATKKSVWSLVIIVSWLAMQGVIGYSGFYTITNTLPPRFILLVLPPLILILSLFLTSNGRNFIDSLSMGTLTWLHAVRIPVEIVLLWLFFQKQVPQLMTFEGRNFDILAGLTAPIIAYLGYTKKMLGQKVILLWNFICIGLLFNIVILAVLSAPFAFQQLAFDQPNIGVFYFPFVWLPCCVVPIVLFSHLAVIRQLTRKQ